MTLSASAASVDLSSSGTVNVSGSTVSASVTGGDCFTATGFEVSKDGNVFASSVSYDCSEAGSNTLYVRATDGSNTSAATTVSLTVNAASFPSESSCTTCTSSLFLEEFDSDAGFTQSPDFTANSQGNDHWGLWNESSNTAVDFGGNESNVAPNDVPGGNTNNWSGGTGTFLVGRDMDGISADPGSITWTDIDVSSSDTLTVSMDFGARYNQNGDFSSSTKIEVFVRQHFSGCSGGDWSLVMVRSGSDLGDTYVFSVMSASFLVDVDAIDMKLELTGFDQAYTRVAMDNLKLSGVPLCSQVAVTVDAPTVSLDSSGSVVVTAG